MKTQHEVLMEDPEFRKLLFVETLVAEAAEVIAGLMAEKNVSKADLARRLNKSRAWVTQLLSGKANMTIRTLAEVVHALDADVKITFSRRIGRERGRRRVQASEQVGSRRDGRALTASRPSGRGHRGANCRPARDPEGLESSAG